MLLSLIRRDYVDEYYDYKSDQIFSKREELIAFDVITLDYQLSDKSHGKELLIVEDKLTEKRYYFKSFLEGKLSDRFFLNNGIKVK